MTFLRIVLAVSVLGCCVGMASGQTVDSPRDAGKRSEAQTLSVKPGQVSARKNTRQPAVSASKEIEVSVHARLAQADAGPAHEGKLLLEVLSQVRGAEIHDGFSVPQPRLMIQLPLSSSADAYGESRSCFVSKEGAITFVFTAGLDENNFVPFAEAKDGREFRFSLNKYICRALAAPFQCKSPAGPAVERQLPRDMNLWEVGGLSSIELESKGAPAMVETSDIKISSSGKPFDYATCAVVAPSNGLCCVQHKTTEWHCGGKPEGSGWHQVSGDCYHRETGGSCSD